MIALAFAMVAFAGCKEDKIGLYPAAGEGEGPEMTNLVVHGGEATLPVPGTMTYSVDVADKHTLSTLDVSLEMGETVLARQNIVLFESGNEHSVTDGTLQVPLLADMVEGTPLTVKFTAVNVPGGETFTSATLNLKRPEIDRLYIFLDGEQEGVEMERDTENPALFRHPHTESTQFSAKFATSADLETAEFAWVGGSETHQGVIGTGLEVGVSANFPTTIIEAITFDVVTFDVAAEGEVLDFSMNGTQFDISDGGLMQASIAFTEGETVPFSGFDDMASAFNPDFFSYDEETEELTYIRQTDRWDVYYSTARNYLYVVKAGAVAPEAYWIVGGGFNSASAWTDDMDVSYSTEITDAAYMVKTAENTYQASVYLKEGATLEFYTDLVWNKDAFFAGTVGGSAASGFVLENTGQTPKHASEFLATAEGFVEGYYRVVIGTADKDNATITVDRVL
jgi:hypothetical protein